jgi:hypothetical protein
MVGCGALWKTLGFLKKCGWPPAALPSGGRSRRFQGRFVRAADVRDIVLRVVNLTTDSGLRGVQPDPR